MNAPVKEWGPQRYRQPQLSVGRNENDTSPSGRIAYETETRHLSRSSVTTFCFFGTYIVETMPVQGGIVDTRALIRIENNDRSR
jgi:hypothetical protein